ncbi:unnamed protein product [Schistosoma curassoni]|uniref:Uncharacterized protein n=1 Tax=Schistosoma curassoni TaxID=6186 RepID=A0A183JNW5_9TREM|nr:unnamed protein product [Schistosoma curassoni]
MVTHKYRDQVYLYMDYVVVVLLVQPRMQLT